MHGQRLFRTLASGEAIALDQHDLVFADEQLGSDLVKEGHAAAGISRRFERGGGEELSTFDSKHQVFRGRDSAAAADRGRHADVDKPGAGERESVHAGVHLDEVSGVFVAEKSGRYIVPVGQPPRIVRTPLPEGDEHPMREVAGPRPVNRFDRVDDDARIAHSGRHILSTHGGLALDRERPRWLHDPCVARVTCGHGQEEEERKHWRASYPGRG